MIYPLMNIFTHWLLKGVSDEVRQNLNQRGAREGYYKHMSPSKDEQINVMNSILYSDIINNITKIWIPIIATISIVITAIVAVTK